MKKELNVQIGSRVRVARKRMNFTREELAEILGVSTLFIGYIECGQKGMSLETLCSLCRALHVSADYLLLGEMPPACKNAARSSIDSLLANADDSLFPLLEEAIRLTLKIVTITQAQEKEKALSLSAENPASHISVIVKSTAGEDIILSRCEEESIKHLFDSESKKGK